MFQVIKQKLYSKEQMLETDLPTPSSCYTPPIKPTVLGDQIQVITSLPGQGFFDDEPDAEKGEKSA